MYLAPSFLYACTSPAQPVPFILRAGDTNWNDTFILSPSKFLPFVITVYVLLFVLGLYASTISVMPLSKYLPVHLFDVVTVNTF